MQIPQVNISAYRRQYETANSAALMESMLFCEGGHALKTTGSQYALISGIAIESPYRGYGAYRSNAPQTSNNIYCPQYYNQKNHARGGPDLFM